MRRLFDLIADAFHRGDSRAFAWVNGAMWALIVTSIAVFAVDLAVGSSHAARPIIDAVDSVILWLFVVEISLRILTFRPPALDFFSKSGFGRVGTHLVGRLLFIMQPLNLVDLVTVLALVPALRGLRALRLLRLLRSSQMFRKNNPVSSVLRAFEDNALLFGLVFSLIGSSTLLGGTSIYLVEAKSNPAFTTVGDGMWWALVTLTTVGYGDLTPATSLGRVLGGVLMVLGMFTLALFAGVVGHTLLHSILTIRQEQFRVTKHINHVVICGYASGASMLLDALGDEVAESETEVILFAPTERPALIPPRFMWIQGDPTKESELDKAWIRHASAVLIVGSRAIEPQQADAMTILTAFTVRSYMKRHAEADRRARPVYIVTEILDAENVAHARTAGADEVIETTRLGFSLLAHAVSTPGTGEILEVMARSGAHNLYLGRVPDHCQLPRSFGEVASTIKRDLGAMVIGVHDDSSQEDILNPSASFEVSRHHRLIYLAQEAVLTREG